MVSVSALVANDIAKRFSGDIYDTLKLALKKSLNFARADLQIGFEKYLEVNIARCDSVKTIINRFQPVSLRDIYEDSNFEMTDEYNVSINIPEEKLVFSDEKTRLIVSGRAGCGKSFFMKRTFIRLCEAEAGYIPIFVELRHLNNVDNPDLIKYIAEQFSAHVHFFDQLLLESILENCNICLLLDGFDELFSKTRKAITIQISSLSYKYINMKIFLSGRPDERLSSWNEFSEYKFCPLNKSSCLRIIEKSKFPPDLRSRFRENVDRRLYSTHTEYLENPLMTYVMMLTSDQFNDFPADVGSFYAKAFETLYSGHDVMKSGDFRREVKCNLKMKELESILSYFCAKSFIDEKYEYTYDQALSYMAKAVKICGFSFDAEDVIEDVYRNYCMLIIDGTNFSYIHRTFQEYFAAVCLSGSEFIDYFEYNTAIVRKSSKNQRYISLVREVGREKFERRYYLPALQKFVDETYSIRNSSPKKFMLKFIRGYAVDKDGFVVGVNIGYRSETWFSFVDEILEFINNNMPNLFDARENITEFLEITSETLVPEGNELDFENVSARNVKRLDIYHKAKEISEFAREELLRLKKRDARILNML